MPMQKTVVLLLVEHHFEVQMAWVQALSAVQAERKVCWKKMKVQEEMLGLEIEQALDVSLGSE